VNEIIRQVQRGQMKEANIPILESSYLAFLPVMSNMNSGLPRLISKNQMNSSLNNLFPFYNAGDISGAELARSIFDEYAGNFMKNISWNLNLKYTGESEMNIANEIAKGIGKSAFGKAPTPDSGSTYGTAPPTEYRGMFDSIIQQQAAAAAAAAGPTGSQGPSATTGTASGPVKLDWKKRAADICAQAARRGLNPADYGCMKDDRDVSETFSFRGYAKMICNRLSTHYTPGIPELCGCPPATWAGWRG
jgi:hypothetical protein